MVAGNWKMHGSTAMVGTLLDGVLQGVAQLEHVDMVVFPPFTYLAQTKEFLSDSPIAWGAQNLSEHVQGAFTGDISGEMLTDFGCCYVLVGHSERRTYHNEKNENVAAKFVRAKEAGLIPILCLGETLKQRDAGLTHEIISLQLDTVLALEGGVSLLQDAIIAYEPVWAIGSGVSATPEQAQEVHAFIRHQIREHDNNIADDTRILYGGSVKASNAKTLFAMEDIDGGLIGGASLDANEFLEIGLCNKLS